VTAPEHVHVVWDETDLPCPEGEDPEECPHPAVRCSCGAVVDLLESPDPREDW
jgi:hypothetical protein